MSDRSRARHRLPSRLFVLLASGHPGSGSGDGASRRAEARVRWKRRRAAFAVSLVVAGSVAFGVPYPAGASISFVKSVGTVTCSGGTASTVTVPAAGVAAGNTLIVRLGLRDVSEAAAVSATDSAGNTYTKDVDKASGSTSPNMRVVILSAHVATALSSGGTITVSHPASNSDALAVAEYSGIATTNRVDATGTGSGEGTSMTASLTTSSSDDLLYGAVGVRGIKGVTDPAGWTTHAHLEPACGGAPGNSTSHGAHQVVSAAGSYTYNPTQPVSHRWAAALVAYKTGGSTPPPAPTITSAPPSPGNDPNPTWSFTGEAGASFECELTRGATVISAFGSCTSPRTYDLSAEIDGTYTFRVRQTDAAGNTGPQAFDDYALDTTAPSVGITGGPGLTGSDPTPTWSFTTEAGATLECELTRGATVISAFGSCTSPKTYDLSAQIDGTYTFRVRATDAAGNVGVPAADSYTLDTAGPSVDITSGPASPGSDDTPTWGFTAEAGATTECELSRGAVVISPYASCTSPRTYDISGQPDADYTLAVRATDGVGNTGTASSTYTLDRAAPAAPIITSPPPSPGNDPTPTWSFTTEAGAATECELSRGATVISPFASCTSPRTYDLTDEIDGDYTFRVRATDAVGNTGPAATGTYTLDRAAPAAPIISSPPPSPGNDATPTWSFTGEAGASFQCELSRGATVISPFASCTSPRTYDLTGEIEGDYTFSVRARDAAGNLSGYVSDTYLLDTTPPGAPTIDSAPVSPGSSTAPSWSFTSEAGASEECQLSRGATVLSSWAPCASPTSYDISGEPDGDYTFRVRAVDAAGNQGPDDSDTYTLDTTGPTVTITSAPASPGNDRSPSWSYSTEAGATAECELTRGASVVNPWSACASPQTFDLAGQPDDVYTISIRATDGVGNIGVPTSDAYTLDTTPPSVSITSGPPALSSDPTPTWGFSTEFGATTECELSSGATVLSPWGPCASPETYGLSAQPDGTYTFNVRATDAAGNTGPPAAASYTLDRSGPVVDITSGPVSPGTSRAPQWTFTTEAGATAECELSSGASVISAYATCSSPVGYDLTGQPDGAYTIAVRAIDGAGNVGAPAGDTYTLDTTPPPEPTITSSPASPGSSTTVSWGFTAEPGSATECELRQGGSMVSPYGACTSPKTYDLAGGPDGGYTFRVRATDAAGNIGPAVASTYTLDTTPPALPVITSAPVSPGTGTSPSWSFTAEAGATTECELTRGATVLQPFTPCISPKSYSIAGEPDGTYTFRVRAIDGLGNTSAAAASSYTLDTVGPSVTITASPSTPGNSRNPTWSFSTEAGATVQCSLARGGTVLYPYAACTSPKAFDLAGEPDGAYTFRARATDALANQGGPAASTYELDTVAPAVTITAGPGGTGSTTSPSWTFTTDPGATTECRLTSAGTTVGGWAACTSPKTFDISGQPDGSYTFHVRASDDAGNTSPEATETYTLATGGGGSTLPPDGGTPLPDGGTPPPDDGGITVPPDGGGDGGGGGGGGAGSGSGGSSEPSGGGSEAGEPSGPTQVRSGTESGETIGGFLGNDGNGKNERKDGADARTSEEAGKEAGGILPSPEEAKAAAAEASARAPRGVLGTFIDNVGTVAVGLIEQPVFPLSLISVVVGFLVLQNRFDRRDPKLALAPVYADPHLYFG